jgi:uncharacterized protein YegL
MDKNEVLRKKRVIELFMETHLSLYETCLSRWELWQPNDYLTELRRLYATIQKKEYQERLRLNELDDPVFFFRSMQNTSKNVFPAVVADHRFTFDRYMKIRNASSHAGKVSDDDVHYFSMFCEHMTATLLATMSVAPAPVWPPANVPPPPRPVKTPTVVAPKIITATNEGLAQVLAFYVLCDTSTSMFGAGINAVNISINEMHAQLLEDPIIADKVRISLFSFSSSAKLEMPLIKPSDIVSMPTLAASGVTNYGRAFQLINNQIQSDLVSLSQTHRPMRPVLFIVTDGSPTDKDWVGYLDELVDAANPFAPTIVIFPCGFETNILEKGFADLTKGAPPRIWPLGLGKPLEDAIRDAINSLTKSIVQTATGGGDTLVVGGS